MAAIIDTTTCTSSKSKSGSPRTLEDILSYDYNIPEHEILDILQCVHPAPSNCFWVYSTLMDEDPEYRLIPRSELENLIDVSLDGLTITSKNGDLTYSKPGFEATYYSKGNWLMATYYPKVNRPMDRSFTCCPTNWIQAFGPASLLDSVMLMPSPRPIKFLTSELSLSMFEVVNLLNHLAPVPKGHIWIDGGEAYYQCHVEHLFSEDDYDINVSSLNLNRKPESIIYRFTSNDGESIFEFASKSKYDIVTDEDRIFCGANWRAIFGSF